MKSNYLAIEIFSFLEQIEALTKFRILSQQCLLFHKNLAGQSSKLKSPNLKDPIKPLKGEKRELLGDRKIQYPFWVKINLREIDYENYFKLTNAGMQFNIDKFSFNFNKVKSANQKFEYEDESLDYFLDLFIPVEVLESFLSKIKLQNIKTLEIKNSHW